MYKGNNKKTKKAKNKKKNKINNNKGMTLNYMNNRKY